MLGSVVFMWPLNNQSPRPPDSKQVGFAKELIDFRDETTLLETLIFKMSFQVLFDWAPVKRLLTFIGARTVTNWDVVEYCKLNIIVELYDAYISASAFAGKLHFQWDLMELQRWNTQRFFDAIVKVFPFSHPWCVGIWFPLTDLVSQGFGLHCPGFPACVAHWTWSSCEKPLRGQSCWDWETGWIYNYMLGYYGSDCTYLCLIIIQCSFIMFYQACWTCQRSHLPLQLVVVKPKLRPRHTTSIWRNPCFRQSWQGACQLWAISLSLCHKILHMHIILENELHVSQRAPMVTWFCRISCLGHHLLFTHPGTNSAALAGMQPIWCARRSTRRVAAG